MNWQEFFAMGGYALYVWASYALAAVVLVVNIWLPLRRRRVVKRNLREFYKLKGKTE
jgi:heme exporter protein D